MSGQSSSAVSHHSNEQKSRTANMSATTTTNSISDHEAAASLMRSLKRSDDDDGDGRGGRSRPTAPPHSKRSRTAPTASSSTGPHRPAQETSYYGPAAGKNAEGTGATTNTTTTTATTAVVVVEKQKANFGLSGALAANGTTGAGGGRHVYKGVPLKFQEPPEARTPNTLWRFYVFKGTDEPIDTLHVARQSAYLFGRHADVCDVYLAHPSCSTQHAVLQYRAVPTASGKISCQPYLLDLESTNGTFLNGVRIDAARYYQLKKGDVVRFGSSQREYVLLTADTKSTNKK